MSTAAAAETVPAHRDLWLEVMMRVGLSAGHPPEMQGKSGIFAQCWYRSWWAAASQSLRPRMLVPVRDILQAFIMYYDYMSDHLSTCCWVLLAGAHCCCCCC